MSQGIGRAVSKVVMVAALLGVIFFSQSAGAQGGNTPVAQPKGLFSPSVNVQRGTDSNPLGSPEVSIPAPYRVAPGTSVVPATPTIVKYLFTPQDENTSTTVLFLYNKSDTDRTVSLNTFYLDGTSTISTSLNVPAHHMARICADTVNTVSASWQNYVLVNFTTFSAYAVLAAPSTVRVEGYVAWDTSGVYDPLDADVTLPIRFSQ
jgi:hypothetical protein